jgi:hypothetical protein
MLYCQGAPWCRGCTARELPGVEVVLPGSSLVSRLYCHLLPPYLESVMQSIKSNALNDMDWVDHIAQ